MTISFSGLASGLDTSSWIQSLTALKQAKVTVLEEKRENVLVSRDTLSSIRSFFATFRSTIEKITDTRFNIATMDLFAQNLATSANLEKLTATATHKAIEGKYEIKIDQIATGSKAISGHRYTQTITEHNIAKDDSLLSTIGVNEGRILVNVGDTGVQKQVRIEEGETIDSFIAKLEALGGDIDAQYDKEKGVFRVNLSASDIIDLDGTNIIGALHLTGVNEGYTSDQLQVEHTEEVFDAAIGTTKFSDLGVNAGTITIQANEFEYDFTVDGNTTLQEFITALEGEDIEASLEDGVFTIKNAIITDDGTTGLKTAFGLVETVSEKAQQSGQLSYATTVVETTYATLETKLADLGMGTGIVNGDTVVVKNSNDETVTINLNVDSTIQDLFDGLEGAGLSAKLNHDGSVEIMGGVITDAGSFDVIDALKLNTDPYTGLATGNALTETIIEYELVTLQTRLHEDLMVKEGFLEVTDSEGRIRYLEINAGDTISNLITELSHMGIYANLDESTGILEITGGEFRTMTNAEVQDAAALGHEDMQGAVAPLQSTDLLELLYGAPAITAEQTAVASTYARTNPLTKAIVVDIIANEDTTMEDLGVSTNQAIILKDTTGAIKTINTTAGTTLGEIISEINASGSVTAELVDGVLKLQGGYLENDVVEEALGLKRDVVGISHVLGDYMTVSNVAADRNTKFSDLGLGTSVVTVKQTDGVEVGTITTNADMTIADFFDALTGYGISASIKDGVITLESDSNKFITGGVADDLGIGIVESNYYTTAGVVNTSTAVVQHSYVVTAGYDTTLGELGYGDTTVTIYGDDNVEIGTLQTNADMTIGDLLTGLASYGINGAIEDGVLSLHSDNGHYATGGVLTQMGVGTTSSNYYTTTGIVNTSSSAVLHSHTDIADMDSLISNFATVGNVTVYDKDGNSIASVSTTGKTFEQLFADLSQEGIQGTISDGVITITSNNGAYVKGLEALGIDAVVETITVTTTTGQTMTGTTQTQNIIVTATMDALISDFATGSVSVYNKNDVLVGTVDSSGKTFQQLFDELSQMGIQGTIDDGVITLTSTNGSYCKGTLLTDLGIETVSTTAVITTTSGISSTGNRLTYQTVTTYTTLVDLTRTFITTAVISVTDPVIGTETYTISDTFTVTDAIIGTETYTISDTFTVTDAVIGTETFTVTDYYTYDNVEVGTEVITVSDVFTVTEPVEGEETIYITHTHTCTDYYTSFAVQTVETNVEKTHIKTTEKTATVTATETVELDYTYSTVVDTTETIGQDITIGPITYNSYDTDTTTTIRETMLTWEEVVGSNTVISVTDEIDSLLPVPGYFVPENSCDSVAGQVASCLGAYGDCFVATSDAWDGSYEKGDIVLRANQGYIVSVGGYTVDGIDQTESRVIGHAYEYGTVTVTTTTTTTMTLTDSSEKFQDFGMVHWVFEVYEISSGSMVDDGGAGSVDNLDSNLGSYGSASIDSNGYVYVSCSDGYYIIVYAKSSSYGGTTVTGSTTTLTGEGTMTTVITFSTEEVYTIAEEDTTIEVCTATVTIPTVHTLDYVHTIVTEHTVDKTGTATREITVTDTFTIPKLTTTTETGTVSYTLTVEKTETVSREVTVTDTFTLEYTSTVPREVTVYDTITIENTSTVPREITVYGTFEITTTTYQVDSTTDTVAMFGESTFSQLGISGNVTGMCGNDAFTVTAESDDTVNDLLTALAGYGISGSISNGVLTLTGTDTGFITGGTLLSGLGITAGNNNSYTTSTETVVVGSNTTSDVQNYNTTIAATSDTTFAQLGASSGISVKVMDNGTEHTISLSASNSVGDLLTALASHGISGNIVNGVLTLRGKEGNYFTDISGLSEFGITANNTSTNIYSATIGVNTTSDYHSRTYNVSMTSDSTFAEWGVEGSVNVYSDGKNYIVDVNSENTVGDLMAMLAGLGIRSEIQNGILTLEGDEQAYITSIDSALQTVLKLSATNYTTTQHTTTDNTDSDEQNYSTTDTLTTQSTFADLKMDSAGTVTVVSDGIEYVINVQTSDTVDDLISTLAGHGITAYVIDGQITFQGDNEAFIKSISANVNTALKLGATNYTTTEHTTTENDESDKQTYTTEMTDKTTLKDLGISTGTVNLYQNGNVYSIAVNENMTIGEFREILASYGVDSAVTDGKISLTDNGVVWLSNGTSNLASRLGIEYDDWTLGAYSQESDVLGDTEDDYTTVNGQTKLVDLQDEDGDSLGITTGEYIVYQNGVRTTETITADTTVQDFISKMSTYGMAAKLTTDGQLVVGANHNTYLATSGATGVATTNAIDILFAEWNFVNIYTSNNLEKPEDVVVAMTESTKLSDINEGTYQEGIISVVKDGVVTNITLAADDTVGTLMNELKMYGFDSTINDAGQLIIKSKNNSKLQNYNGTGASNALDLLGISDDTWIMTKVYTGDPVEVSQEVTSDTAMTRDVLLSELGITTGEYYIYKDGNRETALISSDETLGSFLDTLALAGIQASIINNGDHSILEITGYGDSYVTSSTSVNNRSNVIDVLFPIANDVTNYDYQGELKTSRIVTTYTNATEDTLLNEVFTAWTDPTAKAEGVLSVVVDGVENNINISATESVGSLLGKLNAVGVDAAIVNGEIIIQSGYSLFEIDTTKTTSNIVNDFGLAYHNDLGGYAASSADVISTTTRTEDIVESAAKWADYDTQLSLLNISSGSLAVYKNGEKANIIIDSNETFGQLRTKIANAHEGVDIKFENGYLVFYSTQGDAVEVGSTTDTSNISAICGLSNDKSGEVRSARELYKANGVSKLTTADIFRKGDVTEGTFVVGNATITIDADTTLNDVISQINASADANATANWDSADGKLVIKSRVTGSSMINIEAGTSNFTDIMGWTTTERNPDNSVKSTKIDVTAQEIGQNSMFSINGTYYTSTSNTITSDLTRIEGVTINLKDATEGETVTLTVEKDKETVANAVSDIVDAYNELITNVDEAVAREGQLSDQSTLRFLRNQIRSMMTSSLAGVSVFKNLDAIGITTEAASGTNISTENVNTLYFDKDKFLKAFDADLDAVKGLLVGTEANMGVFTKVENVVETALTGATGYFQSADRSYMNEISKLNEKIRKAQNDVEVYRARLEAKFSAMDQLIANIQNQYSSFLG